MIGVDLPQRHDADARRAYQRAWYAKKTADDPNWLSRKRNKSLDKIRETQRKSKARWRNKNPELARSLLLKWQRENKDRVSVHNKNNRAKNGDNIKAGNKKWRQANPEYSRIAGAKRKALKKMLLHPAASVVKIKALHAEARNRTLLTKTQWEVDHIIPLYFGGWEHELNMQILPQRLNLEKRANCFWEHPEYKSWRDVPAYLWPVSLIPFYLVLSVGMEAKN